MGLSSRESTPRSRIIIILADMHKTICLICLLCFFGCKQSEKKTSPEKSAVEKQIEQVAAEVPGSFSDQRSLTFDSVMLDSFFKSSDSLKQYQPDIKKFYASRNYAFAWYTGDGLIETANNFHSMLQNFPEEGLPAIIPYKEKLDSLIGFPSNQKEEKLQTELLLTGLYFFFARKVWSGLEENSTKKLEWLLPRKKVAYDVLLDSLLKNPSELQSGKEPVYRQYHLLKDYLKKYRALRPDTSSINLTARSNGYHLGDSSRMIFIIKQKLYMLGDLDSVSATNSTVFDSSLFKAVKNFQKRHGLTVNGIIAKSTVAQLNVPLQKRIEQIMINMERCRWLPIDVKGNYVAVNIPEYALHVYHDDSLLWNMDVVVGREVNKTIVFSGTLQYIVFSPYWNVPASILKKEILPAIKRNRNYLAKNHMEFYSGGNVRQKPGPWNSLGQVKILFPNSHSIYFHDTPSKHLFGETKRDFSHGCIRLSDPKKFAMYLLQDDMNWTENKIDSAMQSGKEQYVTLKKTLPVFITYFTSWVDRQGQLNFREDIYDRDSNLAELLISN